MIRLRLATLALVPLLACGSHVVPINIAVISESCDTQKPVTDGVDHYTAVVTAPDISSPITATFPVGTPAPLDQIPAGDNRVLTLTGYLSDGGPAVFGQTVPFTVPDTPDSPVNATVVLRAVNTFAGVATVGNPGTCAKLTQPRAGHTATLLKDGRVLIAGGFSVKSGVSTQPNDPASWVYSDTAEIFDPATNTTQAVALMRASNHGGSETEDDNSAFAAASLLSDGTVMISGGENYSHGFMGARNDVFIYDPSADSWSSYAMSSPDITLPDGGARAIDRSHHVQITDANGDVLIAGGIHYDAQGEQELVPELLWLDPATGDFDAVTQKNGPQGPFSLARSNLSATTVLGGSAIALAGGDQLDGTPASPTFSFFDFENNQLLYVGSLDPGPRSHAAVTSLGPEQALMVFAGGYEGDGGLFPDTTVADSTSPGTDITLGGITPRADPCAVTLPDGRAMVIGGEANGSTSDAVDVYQESYYADLGYPQYPDGGSGPHQSDAGVQANAFGGMAAPHLEQSRKWQTCTVLKDGSVLVTGGVNESQGKFNVLDSIELYTPVPLN